jgi:hypothetical protein
MSEGYELVRVAKEVVAELLAAESGPVVFVRLERQEDGTAEMLFRTAAPVDYGEQSHSGRSDA